MSAADAVEALGPGDAYLVPSKSNPQRVHLIFWSVERRAWLCSCPAPHKRLRALGRYCAPINTILASRRDAYDNAPPVRQLRHLQPVQGGQE